MVSSTSIVLLLENEMKVLVIQSCPTFCDPMDCSPPGSSVNEILQARVDCHSLLWGASWPRDQSQISNIAGRFFTIWATERSSKTTQAKVKLTITHFIITGSFIKVSFPITMILIYIFSCFFHYLFTIIPSD